MIVFIKLNTYMYGLVLFYQYCIIPQYQQLTLFNVLVLYYGFKVFTNEF